MKHRKIKLSNKEMRQMKWVKTTNILLLLADRDFVEWAIEREAFKSKKCHWWSMQSSHNLSTVSPCKCYGAEGACPLAVLCLFVYWARCSREFAYHLSAGGISRSLGAACLSCQMVLNDQWPVSALHQTVSAICTPPPFLSHSTDHWSLLGLHCTAYCILQASFFSRTF